MPNLYSALTGRMDYLVARQGVIAGNIANADTPGYTAQDLVVKKGGAGQSNFAMMVTKAGHMAGGSGANLGGGRLVEDKQYVQHNGNSVRVDHEMLKMSETQMDYRLMTQLYGKQVQMQKLAVGAR